MIRRRSVTTQPAPLRVWSARLTASRDAPVQPASSSCEIGSELRAVAAVGAPGDGDGDGEDRGDEEFGEAEWVCFEHAMDS